MSDRPGIFAYHNNKISASPSKSTSINEISTHFKRSPVKRHESQGPEGGMVIYYSPDAGVISNSKYSSESELQKFSGSSSACSTPSGHKYQQHQGQGQGQGQAAYGEQRTTMPTPSHHGVLADFAYDQSSTRDKLLMKRPMPFLKALEMSNKMEKSSLFAEQNKATTTTSTLTTKDAADNRQSQYEMNYEISVWGHHL